MSFRTAFWLGAALSLAASAFPRSSGDRVPETSPSVGDLVAGGNLEELERRIKAGASPDAGLMVAARNDSKAALELFLELGANPRGLQASRALFLANRSGYTGTARTLTEAGADLEGRDAIGRTLLIFTVENDHLGRLRAVIAAGAAIDQATNTGVTALMTAAANGQLKKARVLLQHGAQANAVDRDGWTALAWAVRSADVDIVRLLLSRGADPNQRDRLGWTPLHLASAQGDAEIAYELLAREAQPNRETYAAGTPLIRAVHSGDVETVRLLLAFGANRWAGFGGRNPLGWARALGRRQVLEILRPQEAGS